MFSKLRYLMMAALVFTAPLAVPLAAAASPPAADSPAAFADEVEQLLASPGIDLTLAQADEWEAEAEYVPAPQQVLEFEFESEAPVLSDAVPDLLDTEIFNRRVTLDFKNADIQNVIRLIAARTGLNILLDPNEVSGRVTLSLDNVPLRDAMDAILKVNKLAYIIEPGNIVRIVPESRVGRGVVETQTVVLELNWRNAGDIAGTFEPFLTTHGSIRANAETQTVIITDVPPNLLKIVDLIRQIDHPDRQVIIQARLVDIFEDQGRNLTSEWALRRNNTSDRITPMPTGVGGVFGPNQFGVPGVTVEGVSVSGGLGRWAFGTTVSILGHEYDLDAALTALETRSMVQVLASPRVTTLNNVPARIDIVQKVPYTNAVQGSGGNTAQNVQFRDAGVTINVKPVITPNQFVRLDIDLKQSIFRGRATIRDGEALNLALAPPIIDERNSQSSVIVENRNTVVLGGLRQIRSDESTNAVPWLNRIPIFGWMFKNRTNNSERTNLVLMVTPEIVEEALPTDMEQNLYDRLDDQWRMPDYFLDDLSNMANTPH